MTRVRLPACVLALQSAASFLDLTDDEDDEDIPASRISPANRPPGMTLRALRKLKTEEALETIRNLRGKVSGGQARSSS